MGNISARTRRADNVKLPSSNDEENEPPATGVACPRNPNCVSTTPPSTILRRTKRKASLSKQEINIIDGVMIPKHRPNMRQSERDGRPSRHRHAPSEKEAFVTPARSDAAESNTQTCLLASVTVELSDMKKQLTPRVLGTPTGRRSELSTQQKFSPSIRSGSHGHNQSAVRPCLLSSPSTCSRQPNRPTPCTNDGSPLVSSSAKRQGASREGAVAILDFGNQLILGCGKRNLLPSASTPEDSLQGQKRLKLVARRRRLKTTISSKLHSDNEFEVLLDRAAGAALGWTLQATEDTDVFRNSTVTVSKGASKQQAKAIYGRTMNTFGAYLFENVYSSMRTDDVFCDIGHGHGSLVQYTAFTRGAMSVGIEMHHHRYDLSVRLKEALDNMSERADTLHHRTRGDVLLRNGRLEDDEHRSFILQANRVYSSRTADTPTLDQYLAGLFARSRKGTEFVVLHPMQGLPPTRDTVNMIRKRAGLRPDEESASFYVMETHTVPKRHGFLSFTCSEFTVYKYTKVTDSATFLCSNERCTMAQTSVAIQADQFVDVHGSKRLLAVHQCPRCKSSAKSLRQRRKKATYRV